MYVFFTTYLDNFLYYISVDIFFKNKYVVLKHCAPLLVST